jgi:hypothetical protein
MKEGLWSSVDLLLSRKVSQGGGRERGRKGRQACIVSLTQLPFYSFPPPTELRLLPAALREGEMHR